MPFLAQTLTLKQLSTALAGVLCAFPALLPVAETTGAHGLDLTTHPWLPVARYLRTFALDTGNSFRLYSQHHGSHVDQHRLFLRTACI